ncbi:MAG: sigma 54-interacting transcriptional regulator [candidate division KSB1 bacterium]|nr:sigma 54-interacting transcriptional regulator [candidate division KSB1 bacterium]MDZ7311641.1 sigma 54-interacting transcriptional regulator [candidate division KSB1 bacterium]
MIGTKVAELYLIHETSVLNGTGQVQALVSLPEQNLSMFIDQEAVKQFFRSALGWMPDGERERAHIEAFRRAYTLASEHGLAGILLNRLFQRALWLGEKVRMETDFFRSSVTIIDVLSEIAVKIFGGLKERAALLAGSSEEIPLVASALKQAGMDQLYFTAAAPGELAHENQGVRITAPQEAKQLSHIDLLLVFDGGDRKLAERPFLQKLMAARNNAPLLLVDLGNASTAQHTKSSATEGIDKIYNLFFFRRHDLQQMVEQNLRARQQVDIQVASWIHNEIQQFYQWLNSEDRFHFGLLVGRSRQMQRVFELIARIAQTDITVLIEGESGSGKELVARAIHQSSRRAHRPFMAVNCSVLPENLLESELFGHVRGAFPGAASNKRGLFEEANGGTIFLDEIVDLSPALQVKLLRFLQEGAIERVGGNEPLKPDVRVIAATNRQLQQMVNEGKFRSDLYYRLNVIVINLPPLRERPEDIEFLAFHFLRKFARRMGKPVSDISREAMQRLREYHWPGNVRELETVMERAVALAAGAKLGTTDFPLKILENSRPAHGIPRPTLKEVERQYILETVNVCGGNYDEAAKVLGISRTTLWRKLKEYLNQRDGKP